MKCLYSHPAGALAGPGVGPTGDCLSAVTGAFAGQSGFCWPFCRGHRDAVVQIVTEHADVREFPLAEVPEDLLPVWEVMVS